MPTPVFISVPGRGGGAEYTSSEDILSEESELVALWAMGATEDMVARKEMTEKTMVQRMLSEMMTAVEEEHYPGAAEAESLRSLFVGRDQDHDPADKIMDQGLKMYDQIVDSGESDGVAKHQTAEPVVVSAGGEEPGLLVMAVMPAEKVNHGKAVAEPIQLLPAGLDSDSEPPDTCMDRSARANDRYKVSTDSAGTTNHRIVDYGGDNIGVEEPELHDLGVERPYGIQTHVRKKENKHEEGNVGTEGIVKAFEKSEPQIKEARDKGEGAISGLGFTSYTPNALVTQQESIISIAQGNKTNSFSVYSRKRSCKKKIDKICSQNHT